VKSNSAYTVTFKKSQFILTLSAALKKDLQINQAILTTISGDAIKANSLGAFKELELVRTNGQRVRIKFLEFRPGLAFDKKHFEFRIPPKTKIIQGK
jgi:outer membrane lipoprotein-sorting protein